MAEVIVIGSYVQDLAFQTPTFPALGETRIGTFRTGAGGKGFNQAVAAHRQGVDTLFIGAIGADLFGKSVQEFIKFEGLDARLQILEEYPTGAASIVVNNAAENLIVVALGANDELAASFIESHTNEIALSNVLVVQLESNLDATLFALQTARANNVITVVNPAPINEGLSSEIVQLADIIVPNETEFAFLLQKLFATEVTGEYWICPDEELHTLCRKLQTPTVVLTLGRNGSFVSQENQFYRVPAREVNAIDSTGAGDAFNGGLAAGLIRYPKDFRQAVRYATVVAGLSTEKHGTAPAMPTFNQVECLL